MIRKHYEYKGIDGYYSNNADTYKNPHEYIVQNLLGLEVIENISILDLCCGDGLVTRAIKHTDNNVVGLDPYFSDIYPNNTGCACMNHNFKDIATGALYGQYYDLVICSFALHLCEESLLPLVLYQLSCVSNELWVITPHKRPDCTKYGFEIYSEKIVERVRLRKYFLK